MRFGVTLPNYGPTDLAQALPAVGAAAEAAGYDSVWASDHILVPHHHGPVYGRMIEALVALGYLAGVTRRVRLGTSVIILPQRDPILLAKQAAGVDQLSNGRLDLGLGVGWMKEQYAYFRSDFQRRGRVADEWIRAMRALWTDDPCSFDGEFVQFENAYFEPKPVQPGGPPLQIGGASDAALRRAAALGDGWHASALTLEEFRTCVARLHDFAGDRRLTISLRAYSAVGEAATQYVDDPDVTIGGPPSAVVESVGQFGEAGLDEIVLNFAHQTLDGLLAQLEMVAVEVIPQFR
jgi:probable F420-dependent oxidoreductase